MQSFFSAALLERITEENMNVGVVDIRFVGGGSFGKVFRAALSDGRVIAVKAYRVQGSQDDEAAQLSMLAQNTSVKMPEVLFTHCDESCSVLGMTFIEGRNALNPLFLFKSKSQKSAFAQAVVSGMSEWHSVRNEKFGELNNPQYDSWCEYYRCEKQQPWLKSLEELSRAGKFSRQKLELLCSATQLFNKVCEEPDSPVLIHGDLNIMNIMADPKTFELNGFIDPLGSMWADREYDLFQFLNMWGNSFGLYDAYKSKSKLSKYTDFRVAYYGAMNEASCRLKGALMMPLWEEQCYARLKKEMKKLVK